MTTVYFVRHGQSVGNLEHRFLGHCDLDLSVLGYSQAEKISEFFDSIDIDIIYSSDLMRAYNTAKPVADKKGLLIHTSKNLREIYAGEWENNSFDYLTEHYPESYGTWRNDIGKAVCDGGESVKELQKRIDNEVNRIVSENKGKKILIATHATPIRSLSCIWNNVPIENMREIPWVTNASVTEVVYNDDGTYKVIKNGFDGYLDGLTSRFPANV